MRVLLLRLPLHSSACLRLTDSWVSLEKLSSCWSVTSVRECLWSLPAVLYVQRLPSPSLLFDVRKEGE